MDFEISSDGQSDPSLAEAQPGPDSHVCAAAQSRRTSKDAIQHCAAPGIGRQGRHAHDAESGRESDLSALSGALDRHAPSAVGRGHQRDRPVARR